MPGTSTVVVDPDKRSIDIHEVRAVEDRKRKRKSKRDPMDLNFDFNSVKLLQDVSPRVILVKDR